MVRILLIGLSVVILAILSAGLYLQVSWIFLIILVFIISSAATSLILYLLSLLRMSDQNTKSLHLQIDQLKNSFEEENKTVDQKIKTRTRLLTAQKNILQTTLSGIDDAIIVVNQNKQVMIFNKAASLFTGYSESAVLGKPIDSVLRILEKNNELTFMHYCPMRPAGFEGIIYQKEGLQLVGKNNTVINLTVRQINENQTFGTGCILTIHNITSNKQLESMKLDFVSMAAHELRTPLTSIKGYLSVFLKENKDKLDAEALKLLDSLNSASEQLSALIENLLSVTRIERGVLEINLEAVDWPQFVKEMVTNFGQRAGAKEIQLEFIPPTQPIPQVKLDKLRITEVLGNLISNAINYTDPGGSIKVSTQFQGKEVITGVTDTGRGIPKEAQSQLFGKFFRVNSALGQGTKGTGLGLYISKSIIDIHHGKIWVESELGKGSTFFFSLPVG